MDDEYELSKRAHEMRLNPTEWEKRLWRHLSNSQLAGYKFRRQAKMPPYIADFFCPSRGLIVEIDGDTHDPVSDARRDRVLAERGFETVRVSNVDVRENMEGVLEHILQRLNARPIRWKGSR